LVADRIPFEVVPGISAALGAAARVGIPLTHRDCASGVTLATAHAARDDETDFGGVPREGTVVFYMGLARIDATCRALIAGGRRPETPAAVISRATLPDERVVIGTLGDVSARACDAGLEAPALLIVGDVVARRVVSPASPATGRAAKGRLQAG
ncbi:MAG: SAM-dependent methyltransferase, partial [Myxococcota bacterium]|nr:SAM-dependent methyltransferase [Myxococcota bacterium]